MIYTVPFSLLFTPCTCDPPWRDEHLLVPWMIVDIRTLFSSYLGINIGAPHAKNSRSLSSIGHWWTCGQITLLFEVAVTGDCDCAEDILSGRITIMEPPFDHRMPGIILHRCLILFYHFFLMYRSCFWLQWINVTAMTWRLEVSTRQLIIVDILLRKLSRALGPLKKLELVYYSLKLI